MQFASKPLLSWSQVMEIAKKSKITTDAAVIAGIKYIELLGHTMYFPGMRNWFVCFREVKIIASIWIWSY